MNSDETIADILREMRNMSKCGGTCFVNDAGMADLADRIEAAAERERVKARHDAEIEWTRIGYEERKAEERLGNAAAPARNCDVGTPKEQKERLDSFCAERDCQKCPFYGNSDCVLDWALAPFTPAEGGAE